MSGLGVQGGQIPAEFRQTMKHNNSNQSISNKKFMGGASIKKHDSSTLGQGIPSGTLGANAGSSIGVAGGVVVGA